MKRQLVHRKSTVQFEIVKWNQYFWFPIKRLVTLSLTIYESSTRHHIKILYMKLGAIIFNESSMHGDIRNFFFDVFNFNTASSLKICTYIDGKNLHNYLTHILIHCTLYICTCISYQIQSWYKCRLERYMYALMIYLPFL